MPNNARADDLVYGFNDKILFWNNLLLSIQFMLSPIVSLVFPVLVVQSVHASAMTAASMVSISLIVIALVAVIQALKMRYAGAGIFSPPSNAPPYLAPSLAAASIGGLPLVFGMTMFAALIQIIFSQIFKQIKDYFPAEIAGMILLLIGIEIATTGLNQYAQAYIWTANIQSSASWLLLLAPLTITLSLSIFGHKILQLYSIIIGAALGYGLIVAFGAMNPDSITALSKASWFFIPQLALSGFKFKASLYDHITTRAIKKSSVFW